MKSILTIILLLWCTMSLAQKISKIYLIQFRDATTNLYGYKDSAGRIVIPAKYAEAYTDTFYTIAIVFIPHEGFVGINRREQLLFHVYPFDNGPDYPKEGLFRISEHGKIGFANMKGEKVIPDTLDFARPFSDGLAAFTEGGHSESSGEHSIWEDGHWGFINKKGEVVIRPQFSKVYDFENGQCEAWTLEGKHVLIDKKGKIVKMLSDK
jgi:hypothetical protein